MSSSPPERITVHRTRPRWRPGAVLLVLVAVVALLLDRVPASSSPTAASPVRVPDLQPPSEHRAPPRDLRGASGEDDGAVPAGTTVFDDGVPGVARLDPALLDALRRAAAEAAGEGVELLVDSGWRSRDYQQQLLDEAVRTYGSEELAARWVATPDTSAHVSGDAVDIGPTAAAAWLSRHGAEHGLCQIYDNEPWHYERRPEATDLGCPPMYADPTQDPRMRR